jgi:hypothetical protein
VSYDADRKPGAGDGSSERCSANSATATRLAQAKNLYKLTPKPPKNPDALFVPDCM